MRNRINNNNVIAEENMDLHGHPAKEKLELWTVEIKDRTDGDIEGNSCKAPESAVSRQLKMDEMDEVINRPTNPTNRI
jgi:hypothetical protein